MRILGCSTVLCKLISEVGSKILSGILEHSGFNCDHTWIFADLYLALQYLVSWRDALPTVALKAIDRELA